MKTIKIAHLYYDLMNLYGENGNITALTSALKRQNIKYEVDKVTKGNKVDISKYDIFYMGMGTENNQEIVRKDILRYKEEFKKAAKKKILIMTGNAYELFGESIDNREALGVFKFKSKTVRERIVGEQVYKSYLLKTPVIGFQNRGSINDNNENFLFEVIKGSATNAKIKHEGIHINNFYGTYTLGPLLIRNPDLVDKIVEDICNENNIPFRKCNTTPDYKAYEKYLENFKIKDIFK